MMMFSPAVAKLKAMNCLDVDAALAALGGKQDAYERIVKMTVRLLPQTIDKLDACMAQKDLKSFTTEVHGIKSGLRTMGAALLGNSAAQLETAARAGDMAYCDYPAFRGALLDFIKRVDAALTDDAAARKKMDKGTLSAAIAGAKSAATDYDAVRALGILNRLSGYAYNQEIDGLLEKAVFALEEFNCEGAIMNMSKIEGVL